MGPKSSKWAAVLIIVLVSGAALALVVVLVKVIPPFIASTDHLIGRDRAEEIRRARTAFLAVLAGGVAVVGAVFTGLAYRLNRAGQTTERFTRAIDQLGNGDPAVRTGAIFALEQLAGTGERNRTAIIEILTTYVQSKAPWPPTRQKQGQPSENMPLNDLPPLRSWAPDVQAMTVLGRRTTVPSEELHLEDVDLRRAELGGDEINFANAHFGRSCFRRAILRQANLADAKFNRGLFEGANLTGANLQGCLFKRAEFFAPHEDPGVSRADLGGAALQDADLRDAKLYGAILGTLPRIDGARYTDGTTWPHEIGQRKTRERGDFGLGLIWCATADP